jgi:hypothetical protein
MTKCQCIFTSNKFFPKLAVELHYFQISVEYKALAALGLSNWHSWALTD